MSVVVWSERQVGKWTDCVFSAYGMALEYGGFSAFPLGANTAAEREAFAGPNANKATGTTLKEADALASGRYGIKLAPLDTTLANALTRPGYALVVTGNYNRLNSGSKLVRDVYSWNNYDKKSPLPSVDHAITIITNADGTLTWLDPTAKQGSAGVPVSKEDVLAFAGGSLKAYPARMVKAGELSGSTLNDVGGKSGANLGSANDLSSTKEIIFLTALNNALGKWTWADAYNLGNSAISTDRISIWTKTIDALRGDTPVDTKLTAEDNKRIAHAMLLHQDDVWGGTDPISQVAGAVSSIAGFLGKLTNPANWLHAGAMLAGVAIIGFGLYTISKDVIQTGPQGMVSPMPIILKEGA